MNITIKSLSPELTADYFDFFDNRAFTDNPPWEKCYCTAWQMTKEEEKTQLYDKAEEYGGGEENIMRARREIVERQIKLGVLQGYLAYVDGVSIGWCNVNDKANFPAECANGVRLSAPTEEPEKTVICFEIAPEYRGKGVATALLNRAVTDAKDEGYAAVEGVAFKHATRYEWDYTGPIGLYEKVGFIKVAEQEMFAVMRNELK